jgi:hypothetical protein
LKAIARLLVVLIAVPAAHAFIVSGGVGGGYFMAYRTSEQVVASPFAPALALQINAGLEGKDIGINTAMRFGVGGTLNPLSSKERGDLNLYAISIPIWIEYPFLRLRDFFLYCGLSTGMGVGIYRNNINQERANLVLNKTSLSLKGEIRIFYPSTFWLELKPGVLSEFTQSGISKTLIWGGEFYVGFSNEY